MTENQQLPGENSKDTCIVCDTKPPLVNHHTSYTPERVKRICGDCHWLVHNRPKVLVNQYGERVREILELEDADLSKSLYQRTSPGNKAQIRGGTHNLTGKDKTQRRKERIKDKYDVGDNTTQY